LAETAEQIAEERRLLYVGVTRAREHLTLTYAMSRNEGGAATRRPSRFLDGLWPEYTDDAVPSARRRSSRRSGAGYAGGAGRGHAGREQVDDPPAELSGEAARLHERLLAWRATEARTASLPTFAILPDVTLRALAFAKPRSLRDLAGIRGIGPTKIARYGQALLDTIT
jgi:DNA helicase-2/ATP-dependent DNA helicase PcrA